MIIQFYDANGLYGAFSNFSRHAVTIYDRVWPTSEHAFQGMKFWPHRMDLVEQVRRASTPTASTLLGRNRSLPRRTDWEAPPQGEMAARIPVVLNLGDDCVRRDMKPEPLFARTKDVIMYEIVFAKFSQHQDLREMLLGTGLDGIVEDAIHDPYWGWGCSRSGQNKLGRILMAVRSVLGAKRHSSIPSGARKSIV